MTGYVRTDTGNNIDNGNVIDAFYLDEEFNGVQAAFHATTGHDHGGDAGEGAPILVIGPAQDFVAGASSLLPKTDNTYDLGSASFSFKDAYIQGTLTAGTFSGPLAATSLTGTIDSARISGSYTGLTGTGALDAGSITSGFGSINIGTDTLAVGNTTITGSIDATVDITAAGAIESGQNFVSTTNNAVISNNTLGHIFLRPKGAAVTTGQFSVTNDGNVSCSGTFTSIGAITGPFSASNLTGTVANARINGSYTSLTGTGALNAGSITSGFGAIDVGVDNITGGLFTATSIISTGSITASQIFASSTNDVILAGNASGDVFLRPQGSGDTGGQFVVNNAGDVTANGTITAVGFSGDGSTLTDLSATELTTGTVPNARLSGSYTGVTEVGTLTDLTVDNVFINSNIIQQTVANSSLQIIGGSGAAAGDGHINLFGQSHATTPGYLHLNGAVIQIRDSTGTEFARFSPEAAVPGLRIGTETEIVTADTTVFGIDARSSGALILSASNTTPLWVKRSNDGVIVNWIINGVTVGSVSTSGGTVTYGTFCGDHWSQHIEGGTPDFYIGTVVDSADEVGRWDEGSAARLPKFKVSDEIGSRSVYGVFMGWDGDNPELERAHIAALGAYLVRVRSVLEVGDLVESAGDGTARLQKDDIIRSSTIGKVISTQINTIYPDGSWSVPCVLYCG